MYKPLHIDRRNLTIMGVPFPDLKTLEGAANALGSNMFEGFEPTPRLVRFYLDYKTGKITDAQYLDALKAAI